MQRHTRQLGLEQLDDRQLLSVNMIADLANFGHGSDPSSFQLVKDGAVVFQAADGLYRTDGTTAGTYALNNHLAHTNIASVGDRAVYLSLAAPRDKLVTTDGTLEGTRVLTTLHNVSGDVIVEANGYALFWEESPNSRLEVYHWRTDGTPEGTYRLSDVTTPRPKIYGVPSPSQLGFTYYSVANEASLYRTSQDSQELETIELDGGRVSQLITHYDDGFYFTAGPDRVKQLWHLDEVTGVQTSVANVSQIQWQRTDAGVFFVSGNEYLSLTQSNSRRQLLHTSELPNSQDRPSMELLTTLGNDVVLATSSVPFEYSLWKVSVTSEVTSLGTITKGEGSNGLRAITLGNRVYVMYGGNLLSTDGTADSVTLLHQATDDTVLPWNDALIFQAFSEEEGYEPWITDGSEAGTRLLKDLHTGSSPNTPWQGAIHGTEGIEVGNGLVFAARTDAFGRELWQTDGTTEGTALVADIVQSNPGSNPRSFVAATDEFFFYADRYDTSASPTQWLYKSDGTESGTLPMDGEAEFPIGTLNGLDIYANHGLLRAVSDEGERIVLATSVRDCCSEQNIVQNGLVFFRDFGSNGSSVWSTDGTAAGTVQLAEDRSTSGFRLLQGNGERLLFRNTGGQVWITDGTVGGTYVTADDIGVPFWDGVEFSGGLILVNDESVWSTDSQLKSPRLLKTGLEQATILDTIGEFVIFADRSGLWSTDGTVAGTVKLNAASGSFIVAEGSMFVSSGNTLYVTDGTQRGTLALNRTGNISYLRRLGETVIFVANNRIYRTDGTRLGTVPIFDAPVQPTPFIDFQGDFYFRIDGERYPIWKTDGTAAGTEQIKAIRDLDISSEPPIVFQNSIIFAASDGQLGTELWRYEPARATLLGDLDQNGLVDFDDFLQLAGAFGKLCAEPCEADLDGDQLVDFDDFLILAQNFGKRSSAAE